MSTPSELADMLEDHGEYQIMFDAAAMLREAERIIRASAVLLTEEGLGVEGTDEWLGVPTELQGSHTWVGNAPEYVDWLQGRTP